MKKISNKKLILVSLLLFYLNYISASRTKSTYWRTRRIVNGYEAELAQFPFQAFLMSRHYDNSTLICGGALISSEFVLTAAHCIERLAKRRKLTLGAWNISFTEYTHEQSYHIEDVIVHPEHRGPINDIGLVRLSRPAKLNKFVQPISLPERSEKYKDLENVTATTTGWGRINATKRNHGLLRYVSNPILPKNECNLGKKRICMSNVGEKGAALGDSGGPLFIKDDQGRFVIIGITSQGPSTVSTTKFTRISRYLRWIKKYANMTCEN